MPSVKLKINNETGLHARPAALFAQTAMQYQSKITIYQIDKKGDAKSVLNILGLGICKGTEIEVEAEGPDENEALAALQNLVKSDFITVQFMENNRVNKSGRDE